MVDGFRMKREMAIFDELLLLASIEMVILRP